MATVRPPTARGQLNRFLRHAAQISETTLCPPEKENACPNNARVPLSAPARAAPANACDQFHAAVINRYRETAGVNVFEGDCFRAQREVTPRMKRILFDWIMRVHARFSLTERTLFLCENILTRFLALQSVAKSELQLLGAAAFWIASKIEEVCPPRLAELAQHVSPHTTPQQLLDAEARILLACNFDFVFVSALDVLESALYARKVVDARTRKMGLLLLEAQLLGPNIGLDDPFELAAATLQCAELAYAPLLHARADSEHFAPKLLRRTADVFIAAEKDALCALKAKYGDAYALLRAMCGV